MYASRKHISGLGYVYLASPSWGCGVQPCLSRVKFYIVDVCWRRRKRTVARCATRCGSAAQSVRWWRRYWRALLGWECCGPCSEGHAQAAPQSAVELVQVSESNLDARASLRIDSNSMLASSVLEFGANEPKRYFLERLNLVISDEKGYLEQISSFWIYIRRSSIRCSVDIKGWAVQEWFVWILFEP